MPTYHQIIPLPQQLRTLAAGLLFESGESSCSGIDGLLCVCDVEFGDCANEFA